VIDQTRLLENNADSSGALLSKKLSNAKEWRHNRGVLLS
jgi:hypothetical protein